MVWLLTWKIWNLLYCLGIISLCAGRKHERRPILSRDVQDPVVKISSGNVVGLLNKSPEGEGVQEFLGIPFAKPPVGNLRFADPEFPDDWSGVLEVKSYGPSCPQFPDLTFGDFPGSVMWNPPNEMNEDCLYLNVWTPNPRPKSAAVMVWIYGGGFYSGSSALWVYDGKTLSGHSDVIVVSMNYRIGSLGFLSTGDGRIKGNFGLLDQTMALRWIQRNIRTFGGDPNRVTIFGESAGSSSVGYHLLSPVSTNLFQRAIMQSGSPESNWSYMTKEQARIRSENMFNALGCPDDDSVLDCLRDTKRMDTSTILNAEWVDLRFLVFPWVPTQDDYFLPLQPAEMLSRQYFKKTDLLIGTNKDEGTYFILYGVPTYHYNTSSLQNLKDFVKSVDIVDHDLPLNEKLFVMNTYMRSIKSDDYAGIRDALDDVVGDRSFICPTMDFADDYAMSGQNVFVYHLTHRASNEVWPDWMGVIHGADIQYVFGMPMNKSRGYSDDEVVLSERIMTYWSNFAKTGRPMGNHVTSLPFWPRSSAQFGEYLILDTHRQLSRGTELRRSYCAIWESLK